jgi:hypothetical protein
VFGESRIVPNPKRLQLTDRHPILWYIPAIQIILPKFMTMPKRYFDGGKVFPLDSFRMRILTAGISLLLVVS